MVDELKVYARKAFRHHDKDDSGVLNKAESQVNDMNPGQRERESKLAQRAGEQESESEGE